MLCVCLLLVLASSLLAQLAEGELGRRLEGAVPKDFWGAVLVARDGRVLYARGYGRADKSGQPVTLDSLFDIGSVSKQFTATAILKLEEQGRLATEDSIAKYFVDVPADKKVVTIHHLLTHTSGIPHDITLGEAEYRERDAMVARVLKADLRSEPGTRFRYSNIGYFLLAALVERASGQAFEAYLKKHVFGPAGMRDTGFVQDSDLDRRRQTDRVWRGRHGTVLDYPWNWANRGATGVVTTCRDLWTWDEALRADKVLSQASRQKLFTPRESGYAMGWMIGRTAAGAPKQSHGGSTRGYSAYLARFPKERAVIVVATNDTGNAAALAGQLEAVLFEAREPPVKVAQAQLDKLAGRYMRGDAALRISRNGDRLRIVPEGVEAAMRLYATKHYAPRWLEQPRLAVKRAVALVPLLEGGKGDEIVEQLRPDVPPTKAKEWLEVWKGPTPDLGTRKSHAVVGVNWNYGKLWVNLELTYERGVRRLRVLWDPYKDKLVNIDSSGKDSRVVLDLIPESRLSFAGKRRGSSDATRLTFVVEDGEVHGFKLHGYPRTRVAETFWKRAPAR